jgi:hypothetical protein
LYFNARRWQAGKKAGLGEIGRTPEGQGRSRQASKFHSFKISMIEQNISLRSAYTLTKKLALFYA